MTSLWAAPTLRPGHSVRDRYVLIETIGEGGFASVWLARDLQTDTIVAIKFLHEHSANESRRFDVESRALMRIENPHCLQPLDLGRDTTGRAYLVTEYVDGTTLSTWLEAPRTLQEIWDVTIALARGLEAAHREGVLHRDLKPDNVVIRTVTNSPVIIDFGIAKLAGHRELDVTKTGEVIGSAGSMSPEQLRGEKNISSATDMYALGVLLFTMLERRPPFSGESALEIAMLHLSAPAPPLSQQFPPQLHSLVAALLDKQPDRRPTAIAVVRALTGDRSVAERLPAERLLWFAAVAGVVVVALFGLAIANALSNVPDEQTPAEPTTSLPKQLVAPHPDPPSQPVNTPDQSGEHAEQAQSHGAGSAGCPGFRPLSEGIQRAGIFNDGPTVRIPQAYDPARRYPVILYFHDAFQPVELAAENIDPTEARVDDYVIIFARGDANDIKGQYWTDPALLDAAIEAIDTAAESVCISPNEVFALGHGFGGRAAMALRCRRPIRAVATFAHRMLADPLTTCDILAEASPHLLIFPTEDPAGPTEGGIACDNSDLASIDAHVSYVAAQLNCAKDAKRVDEQCVQRQCDASFVECRVPGGRKWRGQYNLSGLLGWAKRGCGENKQTDDRVTGIILDFFDRARSEE